MTDIARLRERLHHREARAQVRAEARARRRARRARQRVDQLRQQAMLAGAAARTRWEVLQTGEARALRLARTRTAALAALLPVLLAFGAWSAAGVQAGMVALLSLQPGSAAAAAAWLVEPALIGVVATVILIRARLRSVGGDLDERATRIEWAALSLSILLNAVGHWPASLDATAFAALVGHALGPVGAAGTAYLISVIQDGISSADPWRLGDGSPAPSLMDVEEVEPEPGRSASTGEGNRTSFVWPVEPPSGACLLPIVAATEMPHGEAPVNLTDGAESTSPVNLTDSTSERRESKRDLRKRRTRPARRSTSPVNRKTVEDRARELDALIRSGELTESSSVNRVRIALRCSPENARRAIEWRREHLTGEVTGEPAEHLTGDLGTPSPVSSPVGSGEPVGDQPGEVAIGPHELPVEPVLTAAR